MSGYLDTRVIRILRWLLDQDHPRSTGALAADLGLSQRVVRYRLGAVEAYLRSMGASLERRRGSGLLLDADDETRARILSDLIASDEAPRVFSPDERVHVILAHLLTTAPGTTSLDELEKILEVSKASARRDLQRAEPWLEQRRLAVVRRPGVGIGLAGTELLVRQALVRLMLEAIPEDVLRDLGRLGYGDAGLHGVRMPVGIRSHVRELPIQECWRLVSSSPIQWTVAQGNSELVFSLYLAITASRVRAGKLITLDTGQQRSLVDHPVSATAAGLAAELGLTLGIDFPEAEVAGITEYLLGLATLSAAPPERGDGSDELLNSILEVAARELHPALLNDPELRRGLSLHLERLGVRLSYGLPVHNPLLHDVAARYPEVHAISKLAGGMISEHFGRAITDDEIGYVTMYLSGALERQRLAPSRSALIVCPSGMATAWVLVSRIQAEFPQLELMGVVAAGDFEHQLDDVDIIISTVELGEQTVPVVVVSPLLTTEDVKRVGEIA